MLRKSFPTENRDMLILQCQYHGFWWPVDARRQGISNNGMDLFLRDYPPETNLKMKSREI